MKANPRKGEYRCATCGTRTVPALFEGEWRPMQCPDHPDADMLAWTRSYGYALAYIDRVYRGNVPAFGRGWDAVERLQSDIDANPRYWPGSTYDDVALIALVSRDWPRDIPEETSAPKRSLY